MQIEKRKMYQVVTKLDIVLVNKTVENSFYIEATDSEMKELSDQPGGQANQTSAE